MAAAPTNEQLIEEAKKSAKSDPAASEKYYKEVLSKSPGVNETD